MHVLYISIVSYYLLSMEIPFQQMEVDVYESIIDFNWCELGLSYESYENWTQSHLAFDTHILSCFYTSFCYACFFCYYMSSCLVLLRRFLGVFSFHERKVFALPPKGDSSSLSHGVNFTHIVFACASLVLHAFFVSCTCSRFVKSRGSFEPSWCTHLGGARLYFINLVSLIWL